MSPSCDIIKIYQFNDTNRTESKKNMEDMNHQKITEQMLKAFHEMTDYCNKNGINEFIQLEQVADIVPEWIPAIENDELRRALFAYIKANARNKDEYEPKEPTTENTEETEDIPFY